MAACGTMPPPAGSPGSPMPRFALSLLFALVLAAPASAQSLEVESAADAETQAPDAVERHWYVADMPVTGEGAGERRGAVARALVQVLLRLTGDRAVALSPVVRKAMGHADGLVRESSYRVEGDPQAGTPLRQVLTVEFERSGVEALIAAAGLSLWPLERPQPLLWLAIDDGRGPRLVSAQQLNVVRPLAERGLERGLRFALPAGSPVELAALDSVWAQNAAAIRALSARYQAEVQLLGKLYRAEGGGWSADWLLTDGDVELARWSTTEIEPQRVIADGADGAADALAKRDAVAVDVGEPGPRTVLVSGIASADDFTRVMGYLQTLAVVRELDVLAAEPDQLRLRLDLAVGDRGFSALVAGGQVLVEEASLADGSLRYRLRQ